MAGIRDDRLREGPVIGCIVLTVITHDRKMPGLAEGTTGRENAVESLKVAQESQ
jgi:hypothetical protein